MSSRDQNLTLKTVRGQFAIVYLLCTIIFSINTNILTYILIRDIYYAKYYGGGGGDGRLGKKGK